MVFALAAIAVLPVVTGYLSLSNATEWLVTLGKWAILLIGVALAVSLIYRYGPSREKPQWRWVTWGSAVVAAHFGSYNKKYGSLGAVIGFMTWIWLSTTVVLLGAELDGGMEHQTMRDTTTGPAKPARRGSRVSAAVRAHVFGRAQRGGDSFPGGTDPRSGTGAGEWPRRDLC
jgi:membrane protein